MKQLLPDLGIQIAALAYAAVVVGAVLAVFEAFAPRGFCADSDT